MNSLNGFSCLSSGMVLMTRLGSNLVQTWFKTAGFLRLVPESISHYRLSPYGLVQVVPKAGLSDPTTLTVSPQRLIGILIGTFTGAAQVRVASAIPRKRKQAVRKAMNDCRESQESNLIKEVRGENRYSIFK